MRRLFRFFKYLFRDIMDLSIAVTFIGLAMMFGGFLYSLIPATLVGFSLLVVKVTVIAFTVALVCLAIEAEYRFIRALKNGTLRRPRKPAPIVNVYNYGCNGDCDDCDDCDDSDVETDDDDDDDDDDDVPTAEDEADDPVEE